MAYEFKLFFYGPVDFGHPVAVDVYPEGRDAVYVFFSLGIYKVGALRALDHYGVCARVILHLGKRMPHEFPVVGSYLF